jgi:biopolymer transport protein ExbB/TolQ
MTIAIYGLGIMALVLASIGIWEAWRTFRASREYYRAMKAVRDLRDRIATAEKRHAKRTHLRAELKRATANLLRMEGRLR